MPEISGKWLDGTLSEFHQTVGTDHVSRAVLKHSRKAGEQISIAIMLKKMGETKLEQDRSEHALHVLPQPQMRAETCAR